MLSSATWKCYKAGDSLLKEALLFSPGCTSREGMASRSLEEEPHWASGPGVGLGAMPVHVQCTKQCAWSKSGEGPGVCWRRRSERQRHKPIPEYCAVRGHSGKSLADSDLSCERCNSAHLHNLIRHGQGVPRPLKAFSLDPLESSGTLLGLGPANLAG